MEPTTVVSNAGVTQKAEVVKPKTLLFSPKLVESSSALHGYGLTHCVIRVGNNEPVGFFFNEHAAQVFCEAMNA